MSRVKINNHKRSELILRRRDASGKSLLFRPGMGSMPGEVRIPAGESGYCDFWDEIKGNPVYENWLDRGLISLGEGDDPVPGGSEAFTSFGDTLQAPPNLRQNDPDVIVSQERESAADVQAAPGQPVVAATRRGRKPKVQQTEPEQPSNQDIEQQ